MRGQSIEINVLLSATSGTLNRTVQRQKYTDQLLFRKLMASGAVCKHLESITFSIVMSYGRITNHTCMLFLFIKVYIKMYLCNTPAPQYCSLNVEISNSCRLFLLYLLFLVNLQSMPMENICL